MGEKPPAFQFYPGDWDTDINVIPMTLEEEGVYWALCRLYWINGPLPADLNELRVLLKGRPALKQMERWWHRIGRCFQAREGRLSHKRLDQERQKQVTWRDKSAEAGRRSAEARQQKFGSNQPRTTVRTNPEPPFEPTDEPTPNSYLISSDLISVPSEDPTPEKGRTQNARARPGPLIARRKPWCAWESGVGLDVTQDLHNEFRGKLELSGKTREQADRELFAWYSITEEACQGQKVGENGWKFWRKRFEEWLGESPTKNREEQEDAQLAERAKARLVKQGLMQ